MVNNTINLQLNLYSTAHCHLCEMAFGMITKLTQHIIFANNIALNVVEICDDDVLLNQYGKYIPVLQRLDTMNKLHWPFTDETIIQFITNCQ